MRESSDVVDWRHAAGTFSTVLGVTRHNWRCHCASALRVPNYLIWAPSDLPSSSGYASRHRAAASWKAFALTTP